LGSSGSRGSVNGTVDRCHQGAQDFVGGGRLAEPLLQHLERASMSLVAVGLAGVGDDDGPVLPVGCSAREAMRLFARLFEDGVAAEPAGAGSAKAITTV
jgi:hypothetical protein